MIIEVKLTKEVDVRFLQVNANVRYWDDSTINGIKDVDGDLTPCRSGDNWSPLIDVDAGKIIDWPEDIEASIHFKVCDMGAYMLLEENKDEIVEIDGYVPGIMCPKENGYGDYIIMDIGKDGVIADWDIDLSDFIEED